MDIYVLWQSTTLLIFLLSSIISYIYMRRHREHMRRYRRYQMRYREYPSSLNLLLALFFLFLGIRYLFAFMLRVFVPLDSQPVWCGTFLYGLAIACNGLLPLPAIFFALETIRPSSTRRYGAFPIAVVIAYLLTLLFYPPHVVETTPGVYEYALSKVSRYFAYAAFSLSFLPPVIFLVFAVMDKTKRGRALMYAVGFLIIAYFAEFADPFGLPPVIYVRRAMIVLGLLIIYLAQSRS